MGSRREVEGMSFFLLFFMISCYGHQQEVNYDLSFQGMTISSAFPSKSRAAVSNELNLFQKEVERENLSREQFQNEIQRFIFGLIVISGEFESNSQTSNSIEGVVRMYSSDVLLVGTRLKKFAEKLQKIDWEDEAVYLFEVAAKVLATDERDDTSGLLLHIFHSLGNIYFQRNIHKKSVHYFQQVLIILEKSSSAETVTFSHSQIMLNLAHSFTMLDELQSADVEYKKIIELYRKNNNLDLEFIRILNTSAVVSMEIGNYVEAESSLRESLAILSTNFEYDYTNQLYLSLTIDLVKVMFAQSKWWHGALLLERCLQPLFDSLQSQQDGIRLNGYIKTTAGAYSKAAEVFESNDREKESKLAHEKSVKVIKEWTPQIESWMKTHTPSDSSTCLSSEESDSKPSLSLDSGDSKPKVTGKGSHKHLPNEVIQRSGHILDTLVFITVGLILVSFGLYSAYDISTSKKTQITPPIHTTLNFKSS